MGLEIYIGTAQLDIEYKIDYVMRLDIPWKLLFLDDENVMSLYYVSCYILNSMYHITFQFWIGENIFIPQFLVFFKSLWLRKESKLLKQIYAWSVTFKEVFTFIP